MIFHLWITLCVQEKQDKGSFLRICIGIFEVIGRHVMNRYKKPMILNIRVFRENSSKHTDDFDFSPVSIMQQGIIYLQPAQSDCHDITEILLKVPLNTINQTHTVRCRIRLVRKRRKNRKVYCHSAPWIKEFKKIHNTCIHLFSYIKIFPQWNLTT